MPSVAHGTIRFEQSIPLVSLPCLPREWILQFGQLLSRSTVILHVWDIHFAPTMVTGHPHMQVVI
jgi:hypothetical protein